MTTRRTVFVCLAALAAALLLPAAGLASDAPAGAKPELFDLPRRYDLTIYTLIVFTLLFVILARFAWPAIMKGMHDREAGILSARDAALAAKHEAETIRAELKQRLADAQGEVKAMIEEARQDAAKLRAAEREAGQADAAAERDRAKREIESARDNALQEIYQKSVALAALMSSKAIRRGMTAADHDRLLDESLTELAATVKAN